MYFFRKLFDRYIKPHKLLCSIIVFFFYYLGFFVYLFHRLFKIPYFGSYLFSNQDNYRGRVNLILKIIDVKLADINQEDKNIMGGVKLNILEIGVYCGQMTVAISTFLRKKNVTFMITCVDPWNKVIIKNKKNFTNNFRHKNFYSNLKDSSIEKNFDMNINFSKLQNIVKKKMFSKDFFNQNDKKFDIIIIDGDHTFKNVNNDIIQSKKLLYEKGIIIFDDYEISSSEISSEELIKIKETDEQLTSKEIFIHPGVVLAIKNNFNISPISICGIGSVVFKNSIFYDNLLLNKQKLS